MTEAAASTPQTRVARLSYFFPAHNEEANLEGLVAEALFPEGSSQKDKLHLEIEFPGRSKEEV